MGFVDVRYPARNVLRRIMPPGGKPSASRKKIDCHLPFGYPRFPSVCEQARERQSKDRALQAYDAVNHARMLAAQGDEDARQERACLSPIRSSVTLLLLWHDIAHTYRL